MVVIVQTTFSKLSVLMKRAFCVRYTVGDTAVTKPKAVQRSFRHMIVETGLGKITTQHIKFDCGHAFKGGNPRAEDGQQSAVVSLALASPQLGLC